MDEAGKDNPLRRQPQLRADLLLFWQCYTALDDERPISDGWTPISIHGVHRWCKMHGLDGAFEAECYAIIRIVERHRQGLEGQRRKQEREKREREAKRKAR